MGSWDDAAPPPPGQVSISTAPKSWDDAAHPPLQAGIQSETQFGPHYVPHIPSMPSDRANTVLDIAKQHPQLTPGFIDNHLEDVQTALKIPDMEVMQRTHPVTAAWLAMSPENQARAFDDIPNLQAHEAVLSEGKPPNIFKRAFRYVTEASSSEQTAQAQNLMAISQATGKPPSEITPGQEVQFARKMGAATQPTGKELADAAMTAGLIVGGGEAAAAGKLLSYTGKTALTIGAFAGLNKIIPTETFIPTDANDPTKTAIELADFVVKGAIAGRLAGAIRPVGEFIKSKFAERGIDLPAVEEGKIINAALDKMPEAKSQPSTTEQQLNALDVLSKKAKIAKMSQETYGDHVQTIADQYDKGTLSIKAEDFNKYFQEKGIDPKAEMAKLGANEAEGNVRIPTGKLLAKYVDTEHINGLAPFARFEGQKAPGEAGVILPGIEGKEGPQTPPDADLEAGKALKSPDPTAVDDITATKSPIRAFLDISRKEMEFSGDIEKNRYRLEAANEVDRIHALQLVGKSEGTPGDYEAIYYHNENPTEPLTPEQQSIYEKEIAPLRESAREAFYKLKEKEVPVTPDDYSGRILAGRGGLVEKMMAGARGIGEGGLLRKSLGALKKRVMWVLDDGVGNRKLVSIKGGEVVEWKDKIPTYLGQQKQPTMPKVSEFYDKQVMDKLKALADSLGIKHERVLKGAGLGGNRLGVSFTGGNLIKTKFATPEAVILHEIGHQLDERYDLQGEFMGGMGPKFTAMREEFRKLVDLKWENTETSEYFKKYVRKGPEKIAGMFEAYLQAPERFKEVAPTLYNKFIDFVGSKPELKPILDIKPSMVYEKSTIGGPQEPMTFIDKAGKKWAIKDATTKEIEANTSLTYHKNALVTNLLNYVNMRKVQRSVEFMENLKASPDFLKFATKINTPEYDKLLSENPGGFRESTVPQLRGYVFKNRVANAFDDFYKSASTDGLANAYAKINRFMRSAIFFNPLIHVPNILNHWGVDRGVTSWLNPADYPRLARSTMRAWRAVTTLNQDYIDVMNAGGHLLSSGTELRDLPEMLLKKAGMELNQNSGILAKLGEDLGYANPARLIKAVYDFSGKVTWATNDIATMEAVFERMERGKTMEDAVADTSKHIPNYRVPSEVLNSRSIANIMRSDSGLTMFGAYHYGALKSYGEMLTSLGKGLTGKASPGEVTETMDKIAALAITTYILYPALDEVAKTVTGNKYASFRRAGASTFLYNTQKLGEIATSRQGATSVDYARYFQSVVTPSIGLKAGMEFYFGRDTYNGRPISYGQKILGSISPLEYGRRIYSGDLTGSQFAWGLVGIKTPKRRPK